MTTPSNSGTRLYVAVVAAVVIAIAVAVGVTLMSANDPTGASAATVPDRATDDYGVVLGDPDAAVEVIVYSDFLCPACRQFEAYNLPDMRKRTESGQIRVEYRTMSFLDAKTTTRYSSRAANAFAAVWHTDGPEIADAYREALFAQQPTEGTSGLSDDHLVELGERVGADVEALRGHVRDRTFEQWVTDANDHFSKLGITQTPTVVVNGEPLADPFTGLPAAIKKARQG